MSMLRHAPKQLRELIEIELTELRRRIESLEGLLNEIKFEQENEDGEITGIIDT